MTMAGSSAAVLEISLQTAALERQYADSKHVIELLGKDEVLRRLQAHLILAEDDAEELRDQVQSEQASAIRFTQLVDEHLVRAQAAEAALEASEHDYSRRQHEIDQLHAEIRMLKDTSQEISTIMAEKLTLSREMSILKPEIEHLKAQQSNMEQTRSDKLNLQRQLSEAHCELESARSEAKRALAKRRNTTMEIAQEEQVADLKKELARERRLRNNAEQSVKEAQADMKVDDVRKELSMEKRLREKLEQEVETMKENTEVEDIRRELIKTQKAKLRLQSELDSAKLELERQEQVADVANKRADGETSADDALKLLRDQLVQEKETRLAAEQLAANKEEQLESEKIQLEDKLNQFRTKLREKKEELKVVKADLATTKELAETSAKNAAELAPIKALVKKTTAAKQNTVAISLDETQLGTPGDGPRARRGRSVKSAAVGEKSAFSITPFLNKIAVLDADMDVDNSVVDASPSVDKQISKTPLAAAASIKGNRKPRSTTKNNSKPQLSALTEMEEPVSQRPSEEPPTKKMDLEPATEAKENADPVPLAQKSNPAQKRRQKLRKSLTEFQSFQQEDEPVKQKKRKLGARAPTLFDEEEETMSTTTKAGGLFGAAAYAKLASTKKPPLSVKGRSTLLTATDGSGFQFSPLRRPKKNLDESLRA